MTHKRPRNKLLHFRHDKIWTTVLRVKFPLLRDFSYFDAAILYEVTPKEVELLVELTYGMNRFIIEYMRL